MHELEGVWMATLDDEEHKKQVTNPSVIGSQFALMLCQLMLIFFVDLISCN